MNKIVPLNYQNVSVYLLLLVSNGVPRTSQSEEQEIPITMTSKADFNAVQQKLAKKPFYRKFK